MDLSTMNLNIPRYVKQIHLDTVSNALIYDYANQLIGKIVLNLEQTSLCTGMF